MSNDTSNDTNDNINTNLVHRVRVVTPEAAQKLSDYLPVKLRDFWLCMHPMAQAYIYDQSCSPEEFFSLVDMEYHRFEKANMTYNRRAGKWYHNPVVEEKVIEFHQIVPPLLEGPEK